MIVTQLIDRSILYLISIIIALLVSGLIYGKIYEIIYPPYKHDELKKDFILFQKYLDRYYVKNIWLLLLSIGIYLMCSVGILLFLRYHYLGSITEITRNEFPNMSIILYVKFMLTITLIIGIIICYHTLLNTIFYTQIIKLYIYIIQYVGEKKLFNLIPLNYRLITDRFEFNYIISIIDALEGFVWYVYAKDLEEEYLDSVKDTIKNSPILFKIARYLRLNKDRYFIKPIFNFLYKYVLYPVGSNSIKAEYILRTPHVITASFLIVN